MNKFRAAQPLQGVQGVDPEESKLIDFGGGFLGNTNPGVQVPNAAAVMENLRFEREGIRRDYNRSDLGDAALSDVKTVVMHSRFIEGVEQRSLYRLVRNGSGNLEAQRWTGVTWEIVATSIPDVADVMLSVISFLGVLAVADGTQILYWGERVDKVAAWANFVSGTVLDPGDSQDIVISPGEPEDSEVWIAFDLTVTGPSTGGIKAVVELRHNGVMVRTMEFVSPASSAIGFTHTWSDQRKKLLAGVADGDSVGIKLASVSAEMPVFPDVQYIMDDTETGYDKYWLKDVSDTPPTGFYTIEFDYFAEVDAAENLDGEITIWAGAPGGGGLSAVPDATFPILLPLTGQDYGAVGTVVKTLDLAFHGFGPVNSRIGINRTLTSASGDISITRAVIRWNPRPAGPVATLHPHNKPTDGDTYNGAEYVARSEPYTSFDVLDDAPAARFLAVVGDRVVALLDGVDPQSFAWTRSGILYDFTGSGSGQIYPQSTGQDTVDAHKGVVTLGDNVYAVIRENSIGRVIITGNEAQALGVVPWLTEIGTLSPFSICRVPGGALFLSKARRVLFLTQNGVVDLGDVIFNVLLENLPSANLEFTQGAYDATAEEYYLAIREDDPEEISSCWVLDFGVFQREQRVRWRKVAVGDTKGIFSTPSF